MNREAININNDEAQCEALKAHQIKYMKDNDTKTHIFPIWSKVAMQYEDCGPWMHRVIKEANNSDDNGRPYKEWQRLTG